ncbi:pitrilysin family protein [soil metagenome]
MSLLHLSMRRTATLCSALLIAPAMAAHSQAGATKLTSVEGITEYSLPNGLHFLLFPDASKPTATINVTYLVGSRQEGYGESGMAHLLEHMVFKGTPRHPNIPQELTVHGTRPNGSTWYDRTNYFETVPATDANIRWALELESDRMVNSYIAKKALESEFSVVRNEFEMGENSPFRVLMDRVMSTAYLWHGYGRSTIGSKEDIESVPIDRLKAFYRKYYQPDNAVLVVAGKFEPEKTLKLIEKTFGAIPKPHRSLDRGNLLYKTYTIEPTQDGERLAILRRTGDAPLAMVGYHIPAGSHPDFPAVDVLADILGNEPSGRLYKSLVEPKVAASIGAFTFQLREPGMLLAYAQLKNGGNVDSARTALEHTIDAAASAPVTAEEVARAKAALLKQIELLLANSEQVGFSLSEWASMGDWRLIYLYRDRIEKVTPADVQRVAAMYLKPSNRTAGVFYPTDKPDRTTVAQAGPVEQMVAGYKGRAVAQAGEVFDASPANIDARAKQSTLPNGMLLTLLPKKTRGAIVNAQFSIRFGTAKTLMGTGTISGLTADLLSRGTTALTRQQLNDSLDKLKARVSMGGGGNNLTVSVQATHEALPATLKLLASELMSPRLDPAELDKLKQEQIAQLDQFKSEPQAKVMTAVARRMTPYPKGHPSYALTPEEEIAEINTVTIDQVRTFYKDFYGASFAHMAIVGDFDADSTAALVRTLFGDFKNPQPFERIVALTPPVDSTTIIMETPDKANAFMVAVQNVALRDDDPDYPAMALANYIMGGGFLNSRLATRLRQQEGISYGVGSNLRVAALDRAGSFSAMAIYNPQNVDRLTSALHEEVTKALTTGFTAAEVQAAKPSLLQQREQSRANDPELVNTLITRKFAGRTMAYDTKFEAAINALTPEQVNAAVKKYLDPTKLTIVRAGDFKNKPPVKATP